MDVEDGISWGPGGLSPGSLLPAPHYQLPRYSTEYWIPFSYCFFLPGAVHLFNPIGIGLCHINPSPDDNIKMG
jgi:hypothetical protein